MITFGEVKAVLCLSIRVLFSAGHLKTNPYLKTSIFSCGRIRAFAFQKMMRSKVSDAIGFSGHQKHVRFLSFQNIDLKYTSECSMCTSVRGISSEVFFNLLKLHLHQETRISLNLYTT